MRMKDAFRGGRTETPSGGLGAQIRTSNKGSDSWSQTQQETKDTSQESMNGIETHKTVAFANAIESTNMDNDIHKQVTTNSTTV